MEKIAAAKTADEHEAIAKWYDDQAKEAEDKAAEHRKMGEAYKKEPGAIASKTHFHEHCEVLTRNFTAEAKEYRALAAAHRERAKEAKSGGGGGAGGRPARASGGAPAAGRGLLGGRAAPCHRGGGGGDVCRVVEGSAAADRQPPRRISRRCSGGSESRTWPV